jgi:TonB family protein
LLLPHRSSTSRAYRPAHARIESPRSIEGCNHFDQGVDHPSQPPQPPQQPESTAARTQAVAPPQVASRPLGEAASAPSIKEPAVYADQAAYAAVIRSMVRKNLEVPRNVPDSASALVEVVLSDNGAVTGLRTLTSSGFPAYDAAVRRAIQRAQPYPLLAVPGQEGPLTMRLRFQMKD